MTLTEQATKIINSEAQTAEDIKELSKISYNMSRVYREQRRLCGEMEHNYNQERAEATRQAKQTKEGEKISMGEAENLGKMVAEKKFGAYRKHYEDMVGMREILRQIDAFRISRYTYEKGIDQALNAGVE